MRILRQLASIVREWKKTVTRSPKWAGVRKKWLKLNPLCAGCGSKKLCQVHHVQPFHVHPELELDPKNLITLCMDKNECHLNLGHGGAWTYYNPNILSDIAKIKVNSLLRESVVAAAKKSRLKE